MLGQIYIYCLNKTKTIAQLWHFCTETHTKKLQKLQERGLRIVFCDSNSTYEQLLERAHLKTLKQGRFRDLQCETQNSSPTGANLQPQPLSV
jgi:hypothetical protein